MSTGDSTQNRGLLASIAQTLAGKIGRATVGELDNDRGFDLAGGLKHGVDRASGGAVDGGDGEAFLLGL